MANDSQQLSHVDHTALKVNQAFIIGLLLVAFVLDFWPLAAFVALVMWLGTIYPPLSLFKLVYRHLLRPSGLLKPNVLHDHAAPHRFAQGLGGTFVLFASLFLLLGSSLPGWALVWLVVGLAALNLFLGFCAGCFLYYQLNRLGVPGFRHSAVTRG